MTRTIVHRTRGHGHGPIVRLMSPSDLGEQLKPFVFLDLFEADMRDLAGGMPVHPHDQQHGRVGEVRQDFRVPVILTTVETKASSGYGLLTRIFLCYFGVTQ